jgi:hypothetical protein
MRLRKMSKLGRQTSSRNCGQKFLTSLVLSTNPVEPPTVPQHACEHSLDVPHMAIITVEQNIKIHSIT